ncbi:MAG: hypothetical protein J6C52_10565, partial [Clostridia bacterium]|nr:hypothetical protein [Clostridia bacterium]
NETKPESCFAGALATARLCRLTTACELAERDVCGRAACAGRAALGSTGVCCPRGAGCAGRCGFC